jgi:uncharacterized membrane protein
LKQELLGCAALYWIVAVIGIWALISIDDCTLSADLCAAGARHAWLEYSLYSAAAFAALMFIKVWRDRR